MKMLILAAATLAAPAAAQPLYQPGAPSPPRNAVQSTYEIPDAVVTSFRRAAAPSGTFHTYVEIHARGPGDIPYTVHHTYLSPDQFTPAAGSVCTIRFHYEAWAFVEGGGRHLADYNRPSLVADHIACDTGSTEGG